MPFPYICHVCHSHLMVIGCWGYGVISFQVDWRLVQILRKEWINNVQNIYLKLVVICQHLNHLIRIISEMRSSLHCESPFLEFRRSLLFSERRAPSSCASKGSTHWKRSPHTLGICSWIFCNRDFSAYATVEPVCFCILCYNPHSDTQLNHESWVLNHESSCARSGLVYHGK